MFINSCKIDAALPKENAKLIEYLEKRWQIPTVGCCRQPEQLCMEGPAVVICHTCASIMEESSQASEVQYAWEYIDKDPDFIYPDYKGEVVTLQDCYMARERREAHEAVRSLLKKMNFQVVELEYNREKADFCGLRYVVATKSNKELAPKHFCEGRVIEPLEAREREKMLQKQVEQYTTQRVVTYCGACYRELQKADVEVVHLLELLFEGK